MLNLNTDGTSGDVELEKNVARVYQEVYERFKGEEFDKQFRELLEDRFLLFKRKQASYGPNNIAALGEKGIFVRIWDKVQRLRNLMWFEKPNTIEDESIEDTLSDLAVYAMMTVVLRRGQWPEYLEPPLELPPSDIPSDFGYKWENLEMTPQKLQEYIAGKVKWDMILNEEPDAKGIYQKENRDE